MGTLIDTSVFVAWERGTLRRDRVEALGEGHDALRAKLLSYLLGTPPYRDSIGTRIELCAQARRLPSQLRRAATELLEFDQLFLIGLYEAMDGTVDSVKFTLKSQLLCGDGAGGPQLLKAALELCALWAADFAAVARALATSLFVWAFARLAMPKSPKLMTTSFRAKTHLRSYISSGKEVRTQVFRGK